MLLAAANLPPMLILIGQAVCWAIGLTLLGIAFLKFRRVQRIKADYETELRAKPDAERPLSNPLGPAPFFFSYLMLSIGTAVFCLPMSGVFHADYRAMSRRLKEATKYRAPHYEPPRRAVMAGEPQNAGVATLSAARDGKKTYLYSKIAAPQDEWDVELAAPSGAERIEFESGELQLKAWVSPDPDDGKQHPAIVYLHGGFALGDSDWAVLEPFRKAGFITMTPSLRGENGNPGNFEFFYGEVEDALAAGRYAAMLPYVDEERIYVCGHSIGGQLCVMVAESDSVFRAAVAFSPTSLNVAEWVEDIMRERATGSLADKELIVFNPKNAEEVGLRNPMSFAESIQIPLVMYFESGRAQNWSADRFLRKARQANQPLISQQVSFADHISMLPTSIQNCIPWLQFMELIDPSVINGSNIEKHWAKQSLDSFEVAKTFRTLVERLNMSAYENDVARGMTESEVIALLGEPGHRGQMERSPKLKSSITSATKAVLRQDWTKDTGSVMHTDFNAEGKLVSVSMSNGDAGYRKTSDELRAVVGTADAAAVETILDEVAFAMTERRDRHLVWTSDSQMIVVAFDEDGLARATRSDPNVRTQFQRRRKTR